MARTIPKGKPRFPAWALPHLCLLLSLGAHAWWGMARFGPPREAPPARFAPGWVVLPSSSVKEWTPVLFSLPSSSGFSSALGETREEAIPPLGSPLRLTGPAPLPPASPVPELSDLKMDAGPSRPAPVTAAPFSAEAPAPSVSSGWRFSLLERPDVEARFVRDARLPRPSRFLRVEGEIAFDRHGLPEFLVVDPLPSRQAWVEQVWPDLRDIRLDSSDGPARSRFRLEYFPGDNQR